MIDGLLGTIAEKLEKRREEMEIVGKIETAERRILGVIWNCHIEVYLLVLM